MARTAVWQRKAGQNPEGGLNARGRASLRAEGRDIKAPVSRSEAERSPTKAKRRLSFCRRMRGMKEKLTGAATRNDPDSRINKALRKWEC